MTGSDLPPPSEVFAELFATVQAAGLFEDSKTFADAEPRRDPAAILRDWRVRPPSGPDGIRGFVAANFTLPVPPPATPPDNLPLVEHIVSLWPSLTREAETPKVGSTLIPLPYRHVVPGGRFRELYYWDSYFTMLGLARSGRQDLIEEMIAGFGSLIDRFGRVPNGTRTYYLSRSHPPVFYLMAALSKDRSIDGRRQRLDWMIAEHRFWMQGADGLAPGGTHRRVVRLSDGALLNRYWDDRPSPRDESWREDIELAARVPDRLAQDVWRDLRAAAESGWDFSSRWLGDRRTLETIRTTRLLPVDLNALLHGLEATIADEAEGLGEKDVARYFAAAAATRHAAMETHLWNDVCGFYADYDLDVGEVSDQPTAAMAFPLFAGMASPRRAERTATALAAMVAPGGLLTTLEVTEQQWDAPNGWAPLQWIAVAGLERYGLDSLAGRIADRWVSVVQAEYSATGRLIEKYDVRRGGVGHGGEYATETGFGWTNGVTLEMIRRMPGGDALPKPQDEAPRQAS
ncbi:MAG: alpha,alpha-trehalase TreA [Sphingomonas sp.]|uniref:alpha,alpha-trehalase TreA n=1 Tax=Sphingomonas sp. TaxID=28214 RepID=UPI001AC0590D|nr:alpha,alpha-trehalase TreA [Sphingomonas sp.]MBN8815234.1 alpha,alpha-trehalase TreA [Sphingomonas sp.]